MDDFSFDDIEQAVTFLDAKLKDQEIRDALQVLPTFVRQPIIAGLKTVLDTLRTSIDELKGQLENITKLDEIFSTIDLLMNAAQGLAPSKTERLEAVKNIAKTLENIPDAARLDKIMNSIASIRTSLDQIPA